MRADPRRLRTGSALIEVLVALVLLAVFGTALVTLLGQTAQSMRNTLESERLARAATEQLNRIVIAPRAALLARLGRQSANGWTFDIAALSPTLFVVSIAQSDTSTPLLHTTLYRPPTDTTDASR